MAPNHRHPELPSLTREVAGPMLAMLIEPMVVKAIGPNFDRALLLPQWTTTDKRPSAMARQMSLWLKDKVCLVCGGKKKLQAHHTLPWHIWPQWGMEPRLWAPLCRGNNEIDCHAICGHAGNMRGTNIFVLEFAGMISKVRAMNSELIRLLDNLQ